MLILTDMTQPSRVRKTDGLGVNRVWGNLDQKQVKKAMQRNFEILSMKRQMLV